MISIHILFDFEHHLCVFDQLEHAELTEENGEKQQKPSDSTEKLRAEENDEGNDEIVLQFDSE